MHTPHRLVVAAVMAALMSIPSPRSTPAQDMIATEDAAAGMGDCNCRERMAPPWHGSVAGMDCGPVCPPGNVFHAQPCGQLRQACQVKHGRQGCVTLPPCFPRLHTWFAEGSMPTPRPLALPRCPECGTLIEGGF